MLAMIFVHAEKRGVRRGMWYWYYDTSGVVMPGIFYLTFDIGIIDGIS